MSSDSLIEKLEIVRLFVMSFPTHKHAANTLGALNDIKAAITRQHESDSQKQTDKKSVNISQTDTLSEK